MSLPPELLERMKKTSDIKVNLKTPNGDQAIIEGKTAVPFGAFVKLILKHKLQNVLKEWNDDPIIVSSHLLTTIASSPGESQENRTKLILTAFTMGTIGGMFVAALGIVGISALGITIGQKELLVALSVLLLVSLAVYGAMQIHTRRIRDRFVETVEQVSEMFSR